MRYVNSAGAKQDSLCSRHVPRLSLQLRQADLSAAALESTDLLCSRPVPDVVIIGTDSL
jgi:hypothetical protein